MTSARSHVTPDVWCPVYGSHNAAMHDPGAQSLHITLLHDSQPKLSTEPKANVLVWATLKSTDILQKMALRYVHHQLSGTYKSCCCDSCKSACHSEKELKLENGAVLIAGCKHGGSPVLQLLRLTDPLNHKLKVQILLIPGASLCCRHH
jgi:hypothetical protein